MTGLAPDDITRMRDQLFFYGPERNRRLSRFWLLLPLAAVIASAGVVSDSTAHRDRGHDCIPVRFAALARPAGGAARSRRRGA